MSYRFILEPYNGPQSRYACPQCQHRGKTFKRYTDTETNTYLASHVGRCDREESCGYHYTPSQYFKAAKGTMGSFTVAPPPVKRPPKPFDTIPQVIVDSSLRRYDQNIFCNFLAHMLGADAAISLIERYRIGTASHWPGATIFWQTDARGHTRTGKIMLYTAQNCKRVKEPYNHIAWAHRLLQNINTPAQNTYNLTQCFFGEHLLPLHPYMPVAIVESEKTAIIASHYQPQYLWLAAGSLTGLTPHKCLVLAGRRVVLFPDVNAYPKWQQKADELSCRIFTADFSVDQTLLQTATPHDVAQGNDIADKYIEQALKGEY